MYTALYRAQRPEVFSEILGQEHIVKILKHQIANDSVNHAYLFCGTRGTGKTTTARILAKGLNCTGSGEHPCGECANCLAIKEGIFMDVIEIDAASNNGVENIRELRESVKYPPAIGRKKVYIIDEVHMLSSGAFNALLKTLEEPPENVIFILATTEPQKLPPTILSRCMRLDFKRVPASVLGEAMRKICRDKGVAVSESALKLLANGADGSVRDGMSLLDQVLASGEKQLDREAVLEYIGAVGEEFFLRLTEAVYLKKVSEALILLDEALADGKDVKQLMKDWMAHYRNLLITKFIKNPEDVINMSAENIAKLAEQSGYISLEEINDNIIRLSNTINEARWSTQPRILMELAIVAIATDLLEEPGRELRQERKPLPQGKPARVETGAGSGAAAGGTVTPSPTRNQDSSQIDDEAGAADFAEGADFAEPVDSLEPQAANMKPESLGLGDPTIEPACCDGDEELERIWQEVLEAGENEAGSFNLMRNGVCLSKIEEATFTLTANSDFTRRFAEQKREIVETLMARRTGRPLKMCCVVKGAGGSQKPDSAELAKSVSEILNIEVEIQ